MGFAASHDEITRMLAEHGTLVPLVLLIFFLFPCFVSGKQFQHVFVVFSLLLVLTINHAAMRTAVPALCIPCLY
jgi:hypothetical protein